MCVMNVTARDANVSWFDFAARRRLIRTVESAYHYAITSADAYVSCMGIVDTFLDELSHRFQLEPPYASNQIHHVVWMSLNDNLRNPVRQNLLTEMIHRDVVRVASMRANTAKQGFQYPGVYRYYITSNRDLTLRERRDIYARLLEVYDAMASLVVDHVDGDILVKHAREKYDLPGWSLEGITRGNRRVTGFQQLYEDGRDSFRMDMEGDGTTHDGERVVADVTSAAHPLLRREHHVFHDEVRTQYNFVVDAPLVLMLRRGTQRRAVHVPYAVLDLTIHTRDVHIFATRGAKTRRVYRLGGVRVHSLSTYGFCRRALSTGNASAAGSFFAFWCMETGGGTSEVRNAVILFRDALPGWPRGVYGDILCHASPSASPSAFLETLAVTAQALETSARLDLSPSVTFVSPENLQDTFY